MFALIGTIALVIGLIIFATAIIVSIEIAVVYVITNAIKKYDKPLPKIDERSGKGAASEVPAEIKNWNWAAAFIPMIWGVNHNTWMFLLNYIPGLKLVWWIILGLKGSEWAWRKNKWESVEEFQRIQNRWRPVGIACGVFQLLGIAYAIVVPFILAGAFERITNSFAPNDYSTMWSTTSTEQYTTTTTLTPADLLPATKPL